MRQGYVREPEDIKYLILYCLSLLPITISEDDLLDIVMVDDGFGYFEFAQFLRELIDSKHISEIDVAGEKQYLLTIKGREVVDLMAGHLRTSVCDKVQAGVIRVVRKIRRADSIKAYHTDNGDGTFNVTLTVCDKSTDIISMSMLVYSERQCRILEENFKENAENIFKGLLNLLLDDKEKS
ncbi:MAG: DUF4364 family protein [Clostridiaceae bacterium]|nr:DUF4364 family protein [Clostridiaceae bacterium]